MYPGAILMFLFAEIGERMKVNLAFSYALATNAYSEECCQLVVE